MTVAVNQRVRAEHGANGTLVVMSAWCGKCREQVMPRDDGTCSWCGSVIVDQDSLPVKELLAQIADRANGGSVEDAVMRDVDEMLGGGLEEVPVPDDMGPMAAGASSSPPATGASRTKRARGQLRVELLALLADGPLRLSEIGRAVGLTTESVASSVSSLVGSGEIVKVERGVYALPEGSGRGPQAPREQEVKTADQAGRNRDDAPPAPARTGTTSEPDPPTAPEPSRPDNDEDEAAYYGPTALEAIQLVRAIDNGDLVLGRRTKDGNALREDTNAARAFRHLLMDDIESYDGQTLKEALLDLLGGAAA